MKINKLLYTSNYFYLSYRQYSNFIISLYIALNNSRCEVPNPTPNIVGLGTRMIQEPFWLGLFAVFVVLGMIGLIWCAKRHFPEKIEKLLAEEADRCARRKFTFQRKKHGGQIFRLETNTERN